MNLTPTQRLERSWGKRLRTARKDAGYTQTSFAQASTFTQSTISRYEQGQGTWTPEVMVRFAAILGTSVPELFPWPIGIEDAERFRLGIGAAA